MSSFMDFYRQDIANVLLDTDERAVIAIVNGAPMTIIKDSTKLAELKNKSQYANAIYDAELLIFIRVDELGYIPAVESDMTIDDKTYQVMMVDGDYLLQIILKAVE